VSGCGEQSQRRTTFTRVAIVVVIAIASLFVLVS
jgi:hypothetical protein